MKNFKNFISKHWIGCWVSASILFALIIHFLFSIQAPNKFLTAKWGAGDLLAYASTVTLGFLAMWQNKKQKEENDIAQERLEKISLRANELNIVNKIIEYESNRLSQLQTTMDVFTTSCDPQTFGLIMGKNVENPPAFIIDLTELEKRIDTSYFELARLFRIDNGLKHNDKHPLNKAYATLYLYAKESIANLRESEISYNSKQEATVILTTLGKLRDDFIKEREQYLSIQEKKLKSLLFEELSLEEIRNHYSYGEENTNVQK